MTYIIPQGLRIPVARMAVGAALLAATSFLAGDAQAQAKKLTLALPGVPPIFGAIYAYVAQDKGFIKSMGWT